MLRDAPKCTVERVLEVGLPTCMAFAAMSMFLMLALMHRLNIIASTTNRAVAWQKVSLCLRGSRQPLKLNCCTPQDVVTKSKDLVNAEGLLFTPYLLAIGYDQEYSDATSLSNVLTIEI